jgi:SAM-dependent methyltransferase
VSPVLAQKVSPEAFEARYLKASDPWQFHTSAYEQSRYDTTLRALSRERYGTAYEPGCSVGAFTVKLARIAEEVIATDVSPSRLLKNPTNQAQLHERSNRERSDARE